MGSIAHALLLVLRQHERGTAAVLTRSARNANLQEYFKVRTIPLERPHSNSSAVQMLSKESFRHYYQVRVWHLIRSIARRDNRYSNSYHSSRESW